MKKPLRNLLLTFDYEPFLGARTGTAQNCILKPVEELRKVMSKFGVKGVFFVDVLYLNRLKDAEAGQSDYFLLVEQLQLLHKEGHWVFPHIHPHWIDSRYISDINQYDLSDLTKYSLAALSDSEVEVVFKQAFSFLTGLGIQHEKWGYRAGGWCIQPFERYAHLFGELQIKFEMSVLPHYSNDNPVQLFDYSGFDGEIPYSFSTNVIREDPNGKFVELPISVLSLSWTAKTMSRLIRKIQWKIGDCGFGDGLSAQTSALKSSVSGTEMVSLDLLNIGKLQDYRNFIRRKEFMHWISHPKMITRHGLSVFELFLSYARRNFSLETDLLSICRNYNLQNK